ncbi:MAG: RNA methyltransferase [Salibacteraceae bacterium]
MNKAPSYSTAAFSVRENDMGRLVIPVVFVLDDIRSMANVGSIFRTADSLGITRLVLCGITGRPPHREINKTALGATDSVEWEYIASAVDAIGELKNQGYDVWALEQGEGSVLLSDAFADQDQPLAIVLGNEVKGVSAEVLERVDRTVEIPQMGIKHSLNVAVAAGIAAWECLRAAKERD